MADKNFRVRHGIDLNGNINLEQQGDIRFYDSDTSNYIALQAPSTITSNLTLSLPNADGDDGMVLTTDGSGSLEFKMPLTLQALVYNDELIAITRGQPVYAYNHSGSHISVKLAYNTSDSTSAKTLGVVSSATINSGSTGYITIQGYLSGVDTQAYSAGDTLYLADTAGNLTATKPAAPNHLVYIATVITSGANGRIYVRIQNGYELDEIHDVQILTTPSDGQVLTYEASSSLWKAKTISSGGESFHPFLLAGA